MDISAKLQIKPGQSVAVVAAPAELPALIDPAANPLVAPPAADVVVAFARVAADLDTVAAPAVEAARLAARGVQPVRQVAIDGTWSALRFRPA